MVRQKPEAGEPMTANQAAVEIGVTEKTLRGWIKDGRYGLPNKTTEMGRYVIPWETVQEIKRDRGGQDELGKVQLLEKKLQIVTQRLALAEELQEAHEEHLVRLEHLVASLEKRLNDD